MKGNYSIGTLELKILLAVKKLEADGGTVSIRTITGTIREASGGESPTENAIGTTLLRLEQEQYVTSEWIPVPDMKGKRKTKRFAITRNGELRALATWRILERLAAEAFP